MAHARRWLATIILAFGLAGCGAVRPLPGVVTPIVTPHLTTLTITRDKASELTELLRLDADRAGPVAGLAFSPDGQRLYAVYADEGVLREWRLADGKVIASLALGAVGLGGAAFDRSVSRLALGAGAEWEGRVADTAYFGWRVWDLQNYQLLEQGGTDAGPALTRMLVPSILLSNDGQWVIMVDASAAEDRRGLKTLFMDGLLIDQTGDGDVNFSRKPEEDDFDVIAFDATSKYFAAADEAGKVAIYLFEPPSYPGEVAVLEAPAAELGPRPLALAFDPLRHWLAGVRGQQLLVWRLQSIGNARHIEAEIGEATGITASLAFDPSGGLLAAGVQTGWQLWAVEPAELLLETTATGVYATAFSPDGRLFAWGEASGVVHVMGIVNR